MSPSGPFKVTVHPFESAVRHSCAYEIGLESARNAIIILGGLSDGPHTVAHVRTLAKRLEEVPDLSYSIFETRMRSSFKGFGFGSLAQDVEDINSLVKYLRSIGKEKITLLGGSTGCQDCMEYARYSKYHNEPVEGFILQAPVSDREAMATEVPDSQPALDLAAKMIAEGKENEIMPRGQMPAFLDSPTTAYRFQSLAAKGGDDDYFSSDLDDETVKKIWSRFTKPVLVLHSANDEYIPPHVSQEALNKRYRAQNPLVSSLSGLIPGAGHCVDKPEAQEWLAKTVIEFLKTV